MNSDIAIINDTHFGIRNDSIYFLDKSLEYFETVVFPYIIKNDIKNIIHLGDFFDRRKYINFNTLKEVRKRFLEKIPESVNFHIIIGNHDTYYKNTNEINSLTELFRGYPNIHLYDTPTQIKINDLNIAMIPWMNDSNTTEYMDYIKNCSCPVLMGHLEIIGFEVINGVVHHHGLDRNHLNKFEMVLSGHFHMKQTKKNIHYLGTQYQLNFGETQVAKGFHVLNTNTKDLEFIENTKKIFHIIKYDDSVDSVELTEEVLSQYPNTFLKIIVKCKNKPLEFDKFLDKLYAINTQEITIIDDYEEKIENKTIDITEDTISIINREIDSLQNDLNKDQLKLIIKDLYMEALLL